MAQIERKHLIMKLAISNLSWSEDSSQEQIIDILDQYNVDHLEIATWKQNYRGVLQGRKIVSLQSILGLSENNIFNETSEDLFKEIENVIYFARGLGCRHIVFGCPRNRRINKKRSFDEQYYEAFKFFQRIADVDPSVTIGFEPISEKYNCNFINDFEEALEFVKFVNRDNFKINLDVANLLDSNLIDTNISISDIQNDIRHYVSHIHISEPDLSEIRCSEILRDLITFVETDDRLKDKLYFSIEAKDLTIDQLQRSLEVINRYANRIN